MTDIDKRIKECRVMIQAALQIGSKPDALSAMTDLAALMIEDDKKGAAVKVLAFILNHPDVPYQVYDRADDLFIRLEAELCPRVIEDARTEARVMTLRGVIDEAFKSLQ